MNKATLKKMVTTRHEPQREMIERRWSGLLPI
jgi:hypothetical protein